MGIFDAHTTKKMPSMWVKTPFRAVYNLFLTVSLAVTIICREPSVLAAWATLDKYTSVGVFFFSVISMPMIPWIWARTPWTTIWFVIFLVSWLPPRKQLSTEKLLESHVVSLF